MTVDEKLKQWSTATEALAPSAGVLAALQAAAVAPETPAASMVKAAGKASAAVKVLVVVATIGVLASGVWASVTLLTPGWRWFGDSRVAAPDAGSVACPPRPPQANVAAAPMIAVMAHPPDTRERTEDLQHQLDARPWSCEAQRAPLLALLALRSLSPDTSLRLHARLVALCPAKDWLYLAEPADTPPHPTASAAPCDRSQWCHAPACLPSTEACARRWAEMPATTCEGDEGRLLTQRFTCARLLRGLATEADVRAEWPTAWCLNPPVRQEQLDLAAHHAVQEAP